jgi:hypothetical protein
MALLMDGAPGWLSGILLFNDALSFSKKSSEPKEARHIQSTKGHNRGDKERETHKKEIMIIIRIRWSNSNNNNNNNNNNHNHNHFNSCTFISSSNIYILPLVP